jgi:hypothetical protein
MNTPTSQPMTLAQMEELAWESAIGFYLSDFPTDKEPSEIMEMVEENHEDILIYEPFSGMDGADLTDKIQLMQSSLLRDYKRVTGMEV